jgi:NitT/TauT family transport system permease protein
VNTALAGLRQTGKRYGDGAVTLLLFLLAWQLIYQAVGEVALSPPGATLREAAELLLTPHFWIDIWATGRPFLIALAIETVLGIAIGLVLGVHRLSGDVFEPVVVGFYSVPKIVFYPIILLVFGIGVGSEVVFAILHGILPIILFTTSAVRSVKPVYFKAARVMRLTLPGTLWRVALPAVLPETFTGLRIGFATTLLGVLLSEMFGSKSGLGFQLMSAIGRNEVGTVTSIAFLLVLFAAATNFVLGLVDKRLHRS